MRLIEMLIFAGLLATLASCSGSRSEPVKVRSGDIELAVTVEPAALRVGTNKLWIELRDVDGGPLSGAGVEVKVKMHAMGAMPAMGGPASVVDVGEGRYRADFELAMGSTWNIEITARPEAGGLARAEGSLTVGTPGVRLVGVGQGGESTSETREPASVVGVAGEGDGEGDRGGDATKRIDTDERHPGEFQIPPGRIQRVGVKTSVAEKKHLETTIRAVGRVTAEEATLEDISLKVRGWVGEIFADTIGTSVERGETLFTIYSPELYAAQEEFVQALRSQERARSTSAPERADYLVRSARKRLRLWDIAERDLDRLAETGEPLKHLPIRAPLSGYVVEKDLVEGSAVQPGQRLYRIAPLSRVWIEAEIYEYELHLVREGQKASVTLPYLIGRTLEATVAYVYPTLDPKTRTARLRLEMPNPDLALRPDMYANVRVHADLGERLVVPQSAVLYAGDRSFVFRALGEGRFRPQRVEVGLRSGEQVEILGGLEPGDAIVTSGTFLIASESRLRAAMEQW